MTNESVSNDFIDLHTKGIGYLKLNRIREVTPDEGEPYLSCVIGALRGRRNKPKYTYYDLIVTGTEAARVVRIAKTDTAPDDKVLVGFTIGDEEVKTFVYEHGEKKGKTGACLKARLLFIKFVNVNGVRVYDANSKGFVDPADTVASVEVAQAA